MNLRMFDRVADRTGPRSPLRRRAGRLAGLAAGVLASAAAFSSLGCGTDSDYEAAVQANTVAAYDDYLRLHPDGSHAADARAHLAVLVEEREWQRARAAGTSDGYKQFLRGYASGAHAHEALMAIAALDMPGTPSADAAAATASASPEV